MKFPISTVATVFVILYLAGPARAHPHVWVTVTSEVIYDGQGAATGVRHVWQFDDMYSTFALEGLGSQSKAIFTREELAPLAKVNIDSLKDSNFFTSAKAAGNDAEFGTAADYWLEYKNQVLTLNFTLPFTLPVTTKNLTVDVYDPTYFVDFRFAEKNAVALTGAPGQCKAIIGPSFANRISVTCP